MATPKKSPFATFDKAVDESTLLDFEKEALKHNFRQIVDGLTLSMDFVSMQNGRDVSLSSDYATAKNNFIRNLSNIAIQKFFVEQDYEPLVLYTDTVAGPDGDLRKALVKDCSKIREFMEKGYYRRDKVRDTARGLLTRRQTANEDSKSFAGLKLPRLDISKGAPASSSKYNVGTAKYFMALTCHGEIMTAEEYNEHMSQVLDVNYSSYRNVRGIINQMMDALETQNYQYRNADQNIVTVSAFNNTMTTEQIDKKRQEVLTRLNTTFYSAMREGRPVVFDVKYNPSTKKYDIGGDLYDIFGSAFCNNYGKDIAEWFDFRYGTTKDANGKISMTYLFAKESAGNLDFYKGLKADDLEAIAKSQGYTETQMKNFRRAISLASGKIKRYKPDFVPAILHNNPFPEHIVTKVADTQSTQEPVAVEEGTQIKSTKKSKPADPTLVSLNRVKLYPPYQVEGKKTVTPIHGIGLESMHSVQAYETFSNFKRNLIIDTMQSQDPKVTSSRIKSLSVLDSVIDNLTAMTTVVMGTNTQPMSESEYDKYQKQVEYQLHELVYQKLSQGQTAVFDVVDGQPSADLIEVYKGTPAEGYLEQSLYLNGGLTIPQPQDEGREDIPVGTITVSTEGAVFKKPAQTQVATVTNKPDSVQ